jgi:hypothetical protein
LLHLLRFPFSKDSNLLVSSGLLGTRAELDADVAGAAEMEAGAAARSPRCWWLCASLSSTLIYQKYSISELSALLQAPLVYLGCLASISASKASSLTLAVIIAATVLDLATTALATTSPPADEQDYREPYQLQYPALPLSGKRIVPPTSAVAAVVKA